MHGVIAVTKRQRFRLGQALVAAVLMLQCAPSVLAQSAKLSIGSGSATAGSTVSFPINLTSSGGAQIVGIQWNFSFSADITGVTVFAGPSATNAQKSASCSGTRCLVFGFNNNVVADGTIAIATFQIATFPSNTTIPFSLTNTVISAASGAAISSSGGSGNISIAAPVTSPPIPPITAGASANCAEFPVTQNGQCFTQSIIPWVTFGDIWESRLKMGNLSSGAGGPIQVSFTLLPPSPATNGRPNHIPAYFLDNRSLPAGQVQVGESAIYSLLPNESVSVRFLYPPSGCDTHGENCANAPNPSLLSYGSILVRYLATSPAYLRGLAKAEVTFLASKDGTLYGWQAMETEAPPARMWKAPVEVTYDKAANTSTSQEAAAAITNPGIQDATVRATLYDQNGNPVVAKDFVIATWSAISFTFSDNGGFGKAMFPQQTDFKGWVTFEVIAPSGGVVSPLVLQVIGNSMASVNAQAFP
jgi:hypothetical protein